MTTAPSKTPPGKVLRSLPTLTEVVAPHALEPSTDSATDAIYQRVMQRLELTLKEQILAALREAVDGQMSMLVPGIRTHVEREVRQLIAEAVAAERQARSSDA